MSRTRVAASRFGFLALVVCVTIALSPHHVQAVNPQEVDAAIKKAKEFLRSKQQKDGSFKPEEEGTQYGGHTAIATYALLCGGDSPQDEHIKRAVKWLANAKIEGIYALGLRAQVWTYLEPSKDRTAAIKRDAELLLKSADKFGRFAYTTNTGENADFHNSPTQYGVLGLWACARMGYEVPKKYWLASEQGWFACQSDVDGGWQYKSFKSPQSTATMTVAGLASLFIAQDFLRAADHSLARGNATNPHIEAGLKWVSEHYDPNSSNGYLLYGIERTGVASGYKYFGKHDWYEDGSDTLVRTQKKDGSWDYEHGNIPGTAFGIFFLARGRAPIVMNKLRYEFDPEAAKPRKLAGKDAVGNWNQRPRDVANVVRWISDTMERDLNWQIVNLKVSAADLLDAPILYVSGDQQLYLSAEAKANLKSYVEQGGIILGQADAAKVPFAKSFRELGKELFPAYEFRTLPASHPIFDEQYKAEKWNDKIEVEGLSNGVRELMLLIPKEDIARSWQMQQTEQKKAHFELASNILMYAVDKANLRFKGESYFLKPVKDAKPRRTIKLARIWYDGNWDPEPTGWRRMAIHLMNDYRLALDVHRVGFKSESDVPTLRGFDIIHITGTTSFKLTKKAREEIRKNVEAGATLLIDAAGGSTAFAESAENELNEIFKDDAKQIESVLKPESYVFNQPAATIKTVAFRNFVRERAGGLGNKPRLRAITLKDRQAVFYSKEDLSTGLVGQPVDGVFGYDPKSALQITTNVILYATGEGKVVPATQPTTKPTTNPATKPVKPIPEKNRLKARFREF